MKPTGGPLNGRRRPPLCPWQALLTEPILLMIMFPRTCCPWNLRVAIHCRFEKGMPQEFLDDLRVYAQRLDQRRERVPKGVPADFLGNTGRSCCRLDVIPHHGGEPEGLPSLRKKYIVIPPLPGIC